LDFAFVPPFLDDSDRIVSPAKSECLSFDSSSFSLFVIVPCFFFLFFFLSSSSNYCCSLFSPILVLLTQHTRQWRTFSHVETFFVAVAPSCSSTCLFFVPGFSHYHPIHILHHNNINHIHNINNKSLFDDTHMQQQQ
jgi:hypothetical protein